MEPYIKGDTIKIQCNIDEDITNWKIRASLTDANGNESKIANTNSGGSTSQIEETDIGASSTFWLYFPSGDTTGFLDSAILEIEVDTGETVNGQPEVYTIHRETIELEDEKINWTTP